MTDARKKRLASMEGSSPQKKRRTDRDSQKYYAVRTGVRPGVYLTWPECQKQIAGFRGAQYKSFLEREHAEAFVAGQNPCPPAADGTPQPAKFYAVAVGNPTGVYREWDQAQLAITGIKGPKYKKFETREAAVQYILDNGSPETVRKMELEEGAASAKSAAAAKKMAKAQDKAKEKAKEKPKKAARQLLTIYTDGSSLANGRAGALAGVGVFFGSEDTRNVSEPLKGEPQTNQRAELTAILRALQIAPTSQDVQIFTDSKYAINCVLTWYKGWVKNHWRTNNDGEVKNRDLVEAVRERIDAREAEGAETIITWVKGHSESVGNAAADRLAVAGARVGR